MGQGMQGRRRTRDEPHRSPHFSKVDESLGGSATSAFVKTLPALARRPSVIASILLVVAASCLVVAFGGVNIDLAALVGRVATGVGDSAALPSAPAVIVGLIAIVVAGSTAWHWHSSKKAASDHRSRKDDSTWDAAGHPLIFDISSSCSTDSEAARVAESEENVETNDSEDAIATKRLDPFKGRRQRLLAAARKRTASWVAILIRGFHVRADGDYVEMKLQGPKWQNLLIGSESLPLVSTAFRLEGEVLRLVTEEVTGDKIITLELEESSWALELALALKTLRAEADTGGGVCAWEVRPADDLKRPPPAE
jgi:hypothetical protein